MECKSSIGMSSSKTNFRRTTSSEDSEKDVLTPEDTHEPLTEPLGWCPITMGCFKKIGKKEKAQIDQNRVTERKWDDVF